MVLKDGDIIHIKARNNRRLTFRENRTIEWYYVSDEPETEIKVIKEGEAFRFYNPFQKNICS